jgi:hypothetical protein
VTKMVITKPVFLVHGQCIQNKATTVYLDFFLSPFFRRGILTKFPQGKEIFFFKQSRPVLVPNWNPWALFQIYSGWVLKIASPLLLQLRLRMSGVIIPRPLNLHGVNSKTCTLFISLLLVTFIFV